MVAQLQYINQWSFEFYLLNKITNKNILMCVLHLFHFSTYFWKTKMQEIIIIFY